MSDKRTDLPAPNAANFEQRVRETLMTYLGRQGNPLDRGLTLRDLIEAGIVKIPAGYAPGPNTPVVPGPVITDPTEPDLTPPPTPTGFSVTAAISHVFVEHDPPLYRQGRGHLRTHVYGKAVAPGDSLPTFADAAEVGQFSGTVWALPTNPATTWRLWIKWESNDGVLGEPAGGTNGLAATTGQDVAKLLEALTGEITESQLYGALGARINLIDAPGTGLVTQVSQLSSAVGDNVAALQTEATARATADGALFAQYTVKIDLNGYVSGYGLASEAPVNGTPSSTFAVRADRFYVASPSGPGIPPAVPFVVQTTPTTINGVAVPVGVYITDAFVRNGTITNAKIGNAAIDDAKVANLSASKLTAGSIAAGQFVQSTSYVAGVQGWRIDGNGNAEFSNATVRGTVFASDGQFYGTLLGGSATGYTSGTGFFSGLSGGSYRWRVGNPTGARIQWNGSAVEVYNAGNTLAFSSGGVDWSTVLNPPSNIFNSNISINANGTLSGAGSGQVSLGGLGAGAMATQDFAGIGTHVKIYNGGTGQWETVHWNSFVNYLSKISSGNISTFIETAAIGSAYIGNAAIGTAHIQNAAITAAKIEDAAITTAKIGTAAVGTLKIQGNAVTVPTGYSAGGGPSIDSGWAKMGEVTIDWTNLTGAFVLCTGTFYPTAGNGTHEFAIHADDNQGATQAPGQNGVTLVTWGQTIVGGYTTSNGFYIPVQAWGWAGVGRLSFWARPHPSYGAPFTYAGPQSIVAFGAKR